MKRARPARHERHTFQTAHPRHPRRLAAPPVDGKANAALSDWAARAFRVPKASVQLLHGAAGRQKTLGITLADEKALQAAQVLVAAWMKPDA